MMRERRDGGNSLPSLIRGHSKFFHPHFVSPEVDLIFTRTKQKGQRRISFGEFLDALHSMAGQLRDVVSDRLPVCLSVCLAMMSVCDVCCDMSVLSRSVTSDVSGLHSRFAWNPKVRQGIHTRATAHTNRRRRLLHCAEVKFPRDEAGAAYDKLVARILGSDTGPSVNSSGACWRWRLFHLPPGRMVVAGQAWCCIWLPVRGMVGVWRVT